MHQAGIGIQRLDAALQAVLPVFAPGRHRQQAGRLVGDDQRRVGMEGWRGEVGGMGRTEIQAARRLPWYGHTFACLRW